jgi:hypothetical protein
MVAAWGVLAIGAVAVMIANGVGALTALFSATAASVALFLLAMARGAEARRRRLAPFLEGLQPIAGNAHQKAAALFAPPITRRGVKFGVVLLISFVASAGFHLALSVSQPVAVEFLTGPGLSAVVAAIGAAIVYFRICRMIDDLK